ncbi:mannonate dehydratase [Galbibacter sp. PAP.153]|uniref:mannonate dehydratase n=1 Tax=Galbibacter sp. PAP.153 TaxID=3104623 RepID=UPI003009B9C6
MLNTMRWFGPLDNTNLIDIKQAGAEGIVTALHHIPVGAVWSVEEIKKRQKTIQKAGMEWSVVESLPVHEAIKRRSGDYHQYIKNYKESIKNLAACGIHVVTYNFMPILDWVRTDHNYLNPDGSKTLLFNKIAFAYFDIHLLKRPHANNDYSEEEKKEAKEYGNSLSEADKKTLFKNTLLGLPGSTKNFTADEILSLLENYRHIDNQKLRENLIYFLAEIIPIAESHKVKMAIHPDDPPFSVLGLPRIVSTEEDLLHIFQSVASNANGLCYCTGSLGAHPENNLTAIIDRFGDRIHFLHLRNVIRINKNIFKESPHLQGSNNMNIIVEKIILLMQKRAERLPMRPDHGFLHTLEEGKEHYPGYSLIGRLKGLAELRGLEQGILHKLEES